MNNIRKISEVIGGISYLGRGLLIGKTENGKKAVVAYFITGRSDNSRNRVFAEENGELFTRPFDAAKVQDPSLIIYAAIRRLKNYIIVSNGDQTDTVFDALENGISFENALKTRAFEPDAPNFTPRISGLLAFKDGDFSYTISILKAADAQGSACERQFFEYAPLNGQGHFISTYSCDGNPLPSFSGEPKKVFIPDNIGEFTEEIWNALDKDNRISLYVEYVDLTTAKSDKRLLNKNK